MTSAIIHKILNTKIKLTVTFLTFIFSTLSCQKKEGTTTGNPLVSLKITSSLNSTPVAIHSLKEWLKKLIIPESIAALPPTMTDVVGNAVTLDQGWIVIKEIELEETEIPGVDEVDGNQILFNGPYVVDLFSTQPSVIGDISLNMTSIRRIKMKLHRIEALPASAPEGLNQNSLYFHGIVGATHFSLTSTDGSEFSIGGAKALNVHDNMNLLLSIRIIPLINKIDLTPLLSQSSGVIVSDSNPISGSSCPTIDASSTTIYDCFRKGLEKQGDLGEDTDSSGDIETHEDSVRDP